MSAVIGTKSVLFTDIVGSTELRVRLGEQGADVQRREHDALCAAAIESHAGVVVKSLGDGLMAVFDSAADAVDGAIALQQAAELQGRRDSSRAITLRVGCSIGDVSSEGGDVFGVPVVEAARLCTVAAGGEILAADLVRSLARGRSSARFEPMGEVTLKGLPDPVPACRVLWTPIIEPDAEQPDALVPLPAALINNSTPYVGRDGLRDRLLREWSAAQATTCRTLLLAGEPGVGKTRTAAELAQAAYAEGALVLYGRCDEELGVPYQPFIEALEMYARGAARPALGRLSGELRRLMPELADLVPGLAATLHSDPASEEYRLFEAVGSWLATAARTATGLVLVLDDIHWATKPTLQMLHHVARHADSDPAPILVLATYRDTDIDRAHPLSGMLGELRRLPGCDRIAIDNLDSDEVLEFITIAAGHELDQPTRQLAATIFDETEGNPFFIGEVVRHLIESGAVRRIGDRWTVSQTQHVTVPEGVRDVVGRRLSRLSQHANDVLSVASVFGRDFEVGPLVLAVDGDEGAVLDALDQAVRARLAEETGVDRYRFAHALVRTTLYEELSATRRRRAHRRIADALEKLHPDDVRALAYHCTQAGPDGGEGNRAMRYTVAAAEQALAARAFADAEAGFHAALDMAQDYEVPAELVVSALCGLGEAQRDQSNPGFREVLLDAARRADRLQLQGLLRRAVLSNTRGYVSIVGDVDVERVELVERALAQTEPSMRVERALLLAMLACEVTFRGDHRRRLELTDEAEQLAREIGDPVVLGRVLVTTSWSASESRAWRRVLARSIEAIELADCSGDPTLQVVARNFGSSALLTVGDHDASAQMVEDMLRIGERDCSPVLRWTARANAIRIPILDGRLDDAEAANNAMLAEGEQLAQSDGPQWWASIAVALAWLRGYGGSVADAAGEFAAQYSRAKIWRSSQAWLLTQAGRLDQARAVVSEHELDPVEMLSEPWPFVAAYQLAMTSWAMGDRELASRSVLALDRERSAWSHYSLVVLGPVSWPLGMALATLRRFDEAIDCLAAAEREVADRGYRAYLALIREDLSSVLRRRGSAADADRVRELSVLALADANAVGASGVAARITESLGQA